MRNHRSLCLSLCFADNGYRECLTNGSWAARVNYSECQEILSEEVRLPVWTRAVSGTPARVSARRIWLTGRSGLGSQRLMSRLGEPELT